MAEGYESFFSCTRTCGKGRVGYSGVATFCRVKSAFSSVEVALPVAAEEGFTGLLENSCPSDSLSGQSFADNQFLKEFARVELLAIDGEGRCMITDHGHFVLFNIYGPRADPDDAERIQFKSAFYKVLQKRWDFFQNHGRRIIVVGDLNIAPSAIDRCDAAPDFEKNEFRRWFRSLLVKGGGCFLDVFREIHPERRDAYTCWPPHTGAEEFNYGSRIDHILACGLCLHEVHDMEGHSLISCHVKDCDIMTEFGRWKPGITPRWNGGRSTKLEGSDHVPVYAVLKDIPDIPAHSTPLLSARYIPEIRGFQQNIVSMLMKRKDAKEVTMSCMASCSTSQQAPKLMLCENTKTSARDCSLSSIDSVQYFSSGLVAKESDMKISETGGFAVIIEQECSRSLPNPQKNKKAKPTQPSQRTLKSFFQRVPNLANGGSDSTKVNTSHDEVDSSNSQYDHFMGTPELDQISGMAGKSDDNIRAEEEEREVACTPTQEDKKHASLMEWRRIQERMQASIPLCVGHKEPCVARVVKKQGPNFGRRFYVCARAEGPASNPETRCDFFKWAASKPKNR